MRQASGFRLQASGFGLQASGCRLQGAGLKVQASELRPRDSGFGVRGSGFRLNASGFGLQDSYFEVHASGFRLRGSGFRLQGLSLTPSPVHPAWVERITICSFWYSGGRDATLCRMTGVTLHTGLYPQRYRGLYQDGSLTRKLLCLRNLKHVSNWGSYSVYRSCRSRRSFNPSSLWTP